MCGHSSMWHPCPALPAVQQYPQCPAPGPRPPPSSSPSSHQWGDAPPVMANPNLPMSFAGGSSGQGPAGGSIASQQRSTTFSEYGPIQSISLLPGKEAVLLQ